MSIIFITKHFMYFVLGNGVNLKVRMKNTVSSNGPVFKNQSQGVNINKLQHPASTFSYLPKGVGVKVFNTRIYIKWLSN